MAKPLSLTEVIENVARRKPEAARARRHTNPAQEKPRDFIVGVCALIAEDLTQNGFTFFPSRPKLKRVDGDLTFELAFQSDRHNIAGRRAACSIHAYVCSRKLKQWRRDEWGAREDIGWIAGGQIGNLLEKNPGWMEWDFADPRTREDQVNDALATIRRVALPFFQLFDDPAAGIETLARRPMPWHRQLVEYALAALGEDAAKAASHRYFTLYPAARARFETTRKKYLNEGVQRCGPDQVPDRLAAMSLKTGVDL